MIKNLFTKIKCLWTLDGVERAPTYPMVNIFPINHPWSPYYSLYLGCPEVAALLESFDCAMIDSYLLCDDSSR